MDLCMPTVQGDAILEYLKEQGHAVPVIVISAHLDPEKVEKISRLGARKWISKPFQLNQIAEAICEELGEAAAPDMSPTPASVRPPERKIAPATPVVAHQSVPAPEPVKASAPPPERKIAPATPEDQPAYSALDHEIAQMTSTRAQAAPAPEAHGHHHHRHKRKKTNVKLYVIVALACVFASLIVLAIEKLPAWMAGTFDQAVEKSMQSEIRRQTKGIEGISDKQREALRKAMESKGKP